MRRAEETHLTMQLHQVSCCTTTAGKVHLSDFLRGDFYGVLLLAAVVQGGTVHVLVVERGQILYLLPNPCDFILDLDRRAE